MSTLIFTQEAIAPANDAALALAIFLRGALTTNHDHHDLACVSTKQPWPTVVFDWGHVDFLPLVDEQHGLLTGFIVEAFNADTAGLFMAEVDAMWDMPNTAQAKLHAAVVQVVAQAMEDEA